MIGPMEILLIVVVGIAILLVRGGWSADDKEKNDE